MKEENLLTCDRCGKSIQTDVDKKNFQNYGTLTYKYSSREETSYGTYPRTFSLTGNWEDIHLCAECAYTFHTLLGLYGFTKLRERTVGIDASVINIKR